MRPLVVSHLCVANSLGVGLAAQAEALMSRRGGLAATQLPGMDRPIYTGALAGVDGLTLPERLAEFECRNHRIAYAALTADAFLDAVTEVRERVGPNRIGLFLGTSTSGIAEAERAYRARLEDGRLPPDFRFAQTHDSFALCRLVASLLEVSGPAAVISSACSTTAKVFASAVRMMAAGLCDAAVVGGADSLCGTTLYGFNSLGLVSAAPCRPYDLRRDGISIGEGAGFALLERADAVRRAAPGAVELLGIGESSDAYHMSTPHPEGAGAVLAMERALSSAGIEARAIDYINLHGTGTPTNDAAEDRAVVSLFGTTTPASSTKGWAGHTLGAAGITEAVHCALALQYGFLPGSLNTTEVDPALRTRYLIDNLAERPRRVLSNSFGFGGSNCCLVLGAHGG